MSKQQIKIYGAREHNLKNINLTIPSKKLVVITGVSGSGKSSLAFNTIYNEGKRRYIETFSSYARQFLGKSERPDVDQITGLSPVIAIEQKTISKNPRSTVGSITEIYDFFRLLFSKISTAYSYNTGEKMMHYSQNQIIDIINKTYINQSVIITAPIIRGRKGNYKGLFNQLIKKGFLKAQIDGELTSLKKDLSLSRFKAHDIDIVIDELSVTNKNEKRINQAIKLALKTSQGTVFIVNKDTNESKLLSTQLMCPSTGMAYPTPSPNSFSFNSPYGYCQECKGIGELQVFDIYKITKNGEYPLIKGLQENLRSIISQNIINEITHLYKLFKIQPKTPVKDLPKELLNIILYGNQNEESYSIFFKGLIPYLTLYSEIESNTRFQRIINTLYKTIPCKTCKGSRLKKESLHFKLLDKNIHQVSSLTLDILKKWIHTLEKKLTEREKLIAKEVISEIKKRLHFLLDVGLSYLQLSRASKSLSGGEAQRIRLASQIGSKLVNVLYVLDEPSIGLHPRDNAKLIYSLKKIRDMGNSVIVVEHDRDIMMQSDYIIDIGPKAGKHGGEIIAQAPPKKFIELKTPTADFLNHKISSSPFQEKAEQKETLQFLTIKGLSGNNLKNIDLQIPLKKLVCVTGVSGSGKSSIINETLLPILSKHFYKSRKNPLPYKKVIGLNYLDKVISINQAPIGRTPRSNPATFTKVFTDIRALFTNTLEAKIRGYNSGRFSFNVKGGRCETCKGGGLKLIEMAFLQDVYIQCPNCNGKRYNRETLEVRYKMKSISDVLNMTINEALIFFKPIPSIYKKIKTLEEVGLGYLTLGQSSTTLSGGEAQRVKLSAELSKRQTQKTFYILDEPSTGLHFSDITILLKMLKKLVDKGNTVLIIEHNIDIIKTADYIIDIGPEAGEKGGKIVAQGSPEEIIKNKKSYTAKFLEYELTE